METNREFFQNTFKISIDKKLLIELTFNSIEKGVIVRECVPFDYGPSRKFRDKSKRFHFLILNGPNGRHNLSILPTQIIKMKILNVHFDPARYVKWRPKWFVKRDWGVYS